MEFFTFGTGGIQAARGEESLQTNLQAVREITRGVSLYAKREKKTRDRPVIAAACDCRRYSQEYVREAARILSLEDCQVWIYPKPVPCTALSFAVRYLNCDLGVYITEGFRLSEHYRYKIYGAEGVRLTERELEEIQDCIWEASGEELEKRFGEYGTKPEKEHLAFGNDFDSLRESGKIFWIDQQVLKAFLRAALRCRMRRELGGELKVVYTPLHGAGLGCVVSALRHIGVSELIIVPEQARPETELPAYPDPGEMNALKMGLLWCEKKRPALLLATDSEGSRVGVAVKRGQDYAVLSGNEVGLLLLDYLLRERRQRESLPERPIIIRSATSTELADCIAEQYGAEVVVTQAGFQHIGRELSRLQRKGKTDRFVFAFEEDRCYLAGPFAGEPDAVGTCALLCEMADVYKTEGKTLGERLEELYEEFGCFETKQKIYQVSKEEKLKKMSRIRRGLQLNPDIKFQGIRVIRYRDYLEESEPPTDMVELWLENKTRMVIYPLEEEPKLMVYEERRECNLEMQGTLVRQA